VVRKSEVCAYSPLNFLRKHAAVETGKSDEIASATQHVTDEIKENI
jgi:hypothetical protein